MAAELKIYSDSGCTTEITGTLNIGTLDGTNGETKTTSIWVKNTGTVAQTGVVLTETSDVATRGQYSLNDSTYNQTTITLGDMALNAIVRVYVKVTVTALTAATSNVALNFSLSGTYTT